MQLTKSLSRTPTPLLISRFARLEIETLGRKIAQAFGYNRPKNISLDEIKIPDTQLVKDATELVESCSPQFLVNHSIRTYCFGVAIAKHLNIKADMELFYLSAIMHDLGLVAPHNHSEGSFEVVGADAAQAFMLEKGSSQEKANLVHEAIALHSAVGIAHKREAEIVLVHFGAGVDVIGFRAEDISPETREAIVNAYPRHAFKMAFPPLLKDQVERKPQCHIAGHYNLGFSGKIKGAPFSE
ncbi:MAG: cyanamide hydratase family protein with HD domain [Gammaproteobacteria bacterium]|jgi:cyanamide hydratase family protein with HD domain